jgi:hypothetical protein
MIRIVGDSVADPDASGQIRRSFQIVAGSLAAGDNAYECCSDEWTQPDVGPH